MKVLNLCFIVLPMLLYTWQCRQHTNVSDVVFEKATVYSNAENMWARTAADVNGNGIADIVVTNNNAYGGWLGWFETSDDLQEWILHIIADSTVMGETFAGGDIATADFNEDGKTDVIGLLHPGEWRASNQPTKIYWFENPGWDAHYIGEAPAFVKDVTVADFNNNGKPEIAVITFEHNSLQVFELGDDIWHEILNMTIPNLHEGMDAGDIDGDGFIDIATNGYWLKSPGKDLSQPWQFFTIDKKWNTQDGDWQRNATKVFCADIDRDGKAEVFISHSESKGYPISYYKLENAASNSWKEVVIDSIDGCHTLQVFDFNGDGFYDILAGENKMRWGNEIAPVNLYLNMSDNLTFRKQNLTNEGCYNCIAADLKGNGKPDIIRTAGHSSNVIEVWINK